MDLRPVVDAINSIMLDFLYTPVDLFLENRISWQSAIIVHV